MQRIVLWDAGEILAELPMLFVRIYTKNIYPTDAKTTVGVEVLARTRLSYAHCDVRDTRTIVVVLA